MASESGRPEFSRTVKLDRIGPAGFEITVIAQPAECAALAVRMRLPAINSLSCHFHLRLGPDGIVSARAALDAQINQTCVVSLEEFTEDLHESVELSFVPEGREADDDDPDSVDEIPYAGNTIDLGEAAAEQLALGLDPYPRKPGTALDPDHTDAAANPFAALGAMRPKQ